MCIFCAFFEKILTKPFFFFCMILFYINCHKRKRQLKRFRECKKECKNMSSRKLRNIQNINLVLDLAGFVAFVWILLTVLASTANAQKTLESGARTGFIGRVGIGGEYLNHKAGASRIDGLIMSINGTLGWNWRDVGKLEFDAGFGGGTSNIYGAYPIGATQIGTQPLSNLKFRTAVVLHSAYGVKAGFNPLAIAKIYQYPLFINIGLIFNTLLETATYTPYYTTINGGGVFLELDGGIVLNQKWGLEYLGRFYVGDGATNIVYEAAQGIKKLSSSVSGYGLKFAIGFTYKMGKNAYFFSRLNFEYQTMGAGKTYSFGIADNATGNGLNPGASANVRHPASDTIFSGVQFGFGI